MHSPLFVSVFLLALSLTAHATTTSRHPFDDLDADEVKKVLSILKTSKRFSPESRYPVIRTQEPAKADWLSGKAKAQRIAYCAVFDFKKSLMTEVRVDLATSKILSTKDLPGIKPPLLLEEYDRARAIIKADPKWIAITKKKGIKNPDDVFIDMWGPGLIGKDETSPGQRLLRGIPYLKTAEGKNFYSRPLEGFVTTVDLSKGKVVKIWDEPGAPVAPGFNELDADKNRPTDPPLMPIETKQPDGPSYKVDGQEIAWHKWKIRYAMDPMKGLQLYHVRFFEAGKERSIIYKISLAEMLVPYGAPGKDWSFRNAFDVGEYGLGKTLHPIVLGKDVPSTATLLDSVVPDDLGNDPLLMKGAAVYERDSGLLWKHRNSENGETFIRRGRQLVLTFMTTIGNYDYGVNYVFNLDGTIQVDVQLTGILLARGSELEKNPCDVGCLPLVEKNILAPPHQHFFNFRIDFDIDGNGGNYAAEVNVKAQPKGKNNPDGNIFGAANTVLTHEKSAMREHNPAQARKWKVYNPSSRNELNHPRGYAIMPGETAFPYLDRSSSIRKRAAFIDHPIWFTAYNDHEQSGAAPYPTTAPAGQGLPKYVSNNESLVGRDVVLWYTFGVTHIPRPEEWPVMNVHHTGFTLMPMNFFSRNPAMTLAE